VGSTESNIFHPLACQHAEDILDEHRLCFQDWEAALAFDYTPSEECNP
jgi:hypothetical protein